MRGYISLCVFVLLLSSAVGPAGAYKLPDTGQTLCYDDLGNVIPCPAPGQPLARDGSYNINPLSYTDKGNGTVSDNNTGLMWQKEDDNTTRTFDQAVAYCTDLSLGGYSDWRLPSKKELLGIVDYQIQDPYQPGPYILANYFPTTNLSNYWTSTTNAFFTTMAWNIGFGNGFAGTNSKLGGGSVAYVRCVRGGAQPVASFVDNGNGTVTDKVTGLMWQQGEPGAKSWTDALSYCEGLSLGTHSDWRLPNIKELESITDDKRGGYTTAIDPAFFPGANASNIYNDGAHYWSSTHGDNSNEVACIVGFILGVVDTQGSGVNYVRCVRGGQPADSKPVLGTLTPSSAATTSGTVQKFTAVYSDADGYADLKSVDFLVSPTGTGANSIWARYNRAMNTIFLYNDAGTALLSGSCTPGVVGSLQNTQGKINCGGTTVAKAGKNLTITWSLTPKAAFASATEKKLKMNAVDKANAASGWAVKGHWTINP